MTNNVCYCFGKCEFWCVSVCVFVFLSFAVLAPGPRVPLASLNLFLSGHRHCYLPVGSCPLWLASRDTLLLCNVSMSLWLWVHLGKGNEKQYLMAECNERVQNTLSRISHTSVLSRLNHSACTACSFIAVVVCFRCYLSHSFQIFLALRVPAHPSL